MTTRPASTRLKEFVSHRVSEPRLRRVLMIVYYRLRVLRRWTHRVQHRSRQAALQAGRLLLFVTGRGRRVGAFVVVASAQTGEQASSPLIQSINTAVGAGIHVEVLLVDYDADLDAGFVAAVERGEIPAGVVVRRFWRDAVPGAGLARPRHTTTGFVAEPAPAGRAGEWHTAFYRAGIPVLAVNKTSAAAKTVEFYGRLGQSVRREEIDAGGNLVRIVDVHPDTGQAVTHRYPTGHDTCWLSVWVNPEDGSLGPAFQLLPAPRSFPSLTAAHAQWVDQVVSRTARPVLIAADAPSHEVLRRVQHTGSIRYALADVLTASQWQGVVSRTGAGAVESLHELR